MRSHDRIKAIETDIAYVQSESDWRRSHIDQDLEMIPDPIGRFHYLRRIEELHDRRDQLRLRLRRERDLVAG